MAEFEVVWKNKNHDSTDLTHAFRRLNPLFSIVKPWGNSFSIKDDINLDLTTADESNKELNGFDKRRKL